MSLTARVHTHVRNTEGSSEPLAGGLPPCYRLPHNLPIRQSGTTSSLHSLIPSSACSQPTLHSRLLFLGRATSIHSSPYCTPAQQREGPGRRDWATRARARVLCYDNWRMVQRTVYNKVSALVSSHEPINTADAQSLIYIYIYKYSAYDITAD